MRNGAEALFMVSRLDSTGAKEYKSDRSRQELSKEYLVAKIGFDTAENEPLKVSRSMISQIMFHIIMTDADMHIAS